MKLLLFSAMVMSLGCTSFSDYSRSTPALSSLADSIRLESSSQVHTVRWNPANCDCPGWELKLSDRWLRISIRAIGDDAQEIMEERKTGEEFDVEGPLSPSPYRCGATLLCGSLTLTNLATSAEPLP